MAAPDVKAVIEFLRSNGFADTESALRDDISYNGNLESFDFELFLFPVPPPVRVPADPRQSEAISAFQESESTSGSDDEFVSLGSSVTDACSSEFTNPYGLRAVTHAASESSSDRLSEFGTARAYPDFDMQNDLYWYNDEDNAQFLSPSYGGASDFLGCPSEDKFIMTSDSGKQCDNPVVMDHTFSGFHPFLTVDYLDKPCHYNDTGADYVSEVHVPERYHLSDKTPPEGVKGEFDSLTAYDCKKTICESCSAGESDCGNCDIHDKELNVNSVDYCPVKVVDENLINSCTESKQSVDRSFTFTLKGHSENDCVEGCRGSSDLNVQFAELDLQTKCNDLKDGEEDVRRPLHLGPGADEEDDSAEDELPIYDAFEDEHEIFDLRIIHRKNRTGFEESKDFPIVLNSMIAGRYYVMEYLGSAAFSKVVQAHDTHTGVDVCLKIIKNDKDFFDQSLDEIKLLKIVNKYDPLDERHILRLYDYFYHQEHLFIVCELLRANLYEFQKFNQESGGEPYFTVRRLQFIAKQCLEALEYLHHLRIVHCDLKPENILIKSYSRCEIKVIDLGSSCFLTDSLGLYVQSRSYRAPEVILGLPYDERIDIWSLGCILAELCSGEVLFPNDAVVTLLARMIELLGPIDLEMLVKGKETNKYFTKEYNLYHTNEETDQVEHIIPEPSSLEHQLQVSDIGFIDFLRELLEINPKRRPTAREALEHPWLSCDYF